MDRYFKPQTPLKNGNGDYIYPLTLAEQVVVDPETNERLPSKIADIVYPVGSIYMSVNNVDPSTLFGGTWERVSQGRAIFGADSEHAGGTTAEAGLPNITGAVETVSNMIHYVGTGISYENENAFRVLKIASNVDASASTAFQTQPTGFTFDASLSNPIYGRSPTVQPPALYVYMWKRTA